MELQKSIFDNLVNGSGFDEPTFRKVLGKLKGCKGRMFQTNCLIEHWLTNMEIEK